MKILTAYVTYNPSPECLLRSLQAVGESSADILIADNSDRDGQRVSDICTECRVKYMDMGGNKGMGKALNVIFAEAERQGYTHVLTFDQDSVPAEGMTEALSSFMNGENGNGTGQVGPLYSFGRKMLSHRQHGEFEDVDHVITSGSLTLVEAWKSVGGFREDLFIDMVDVDFSRRLRKAGFKVVRLNSVVMEHHLGDGIKGIRLFGKDRLCFADHAPERWYYITRNTLEIDGRFIWKPFLRMLLSGSGRTERIRYVLKGVRDYRNGVFGEISKDL